MSDPTNDPAAASNLIGWLAAILVGIFGWLGKRQVSRIDRIEARSVDRKEYNQTIQSLREEIRGGHEKTQSLIIDLYRNQHNKN